MRFSGSYPKLKISTAVAAPDVSGVSDASDVADTVDVFGASEGLEAAFEGLAAVDAFGSSGGLEAAFEVFDVFGLDAVFDAFEAPEGSEAAFEGAVNAGMRFCTFGADSGAGTADGRGGGLVSTGLIPASSLS